MNDFLFVLIQKLKKRINAIKANKSARFVIGTSTAGWTVNDCDYLCDGANDHLEINAAITALPATGGEIIILDGTYNIAAKINVNKSNISIKGNGNATVLKRMWNSNVDEGVVTLTSVNHCKISDLNINGYKSSYTYTHNYCIYGNSANHCSIFEIYYYNSKGGISLISSSYSSVLHNCCELMDNYGISFLNSSECTIIENVCNNCMFGIYLNGSTVCKLIGNSCSNNSYALILMSSSNNIVIGNTCNTSINAGIRVESSSNFNILSSNFCKDNYTGIQIYVSSNNNTIVSNNCFRGAGLSTDYTTYQDSIVISLGASASNYNLVSSNHCMGKNAVVEGGVSNTLVNNKYN